MTSILRTIEITKRFSGLVAVKKVSFEVDEQKIVGIIGPNGAGKSTLLNLIAGAYRPTSGHIIYDEKDITRLSGHERCKRGIARTYQHPKPLADHTTLENVMVGTMFGRRRASKRDAKDEALRYLNIVGLEEKSSIKAAELNFVELKKIEIARALATKPRLLLLDEPVAGLTPAEVNEFAELIRKTNASGTTIVLIEHVLKAVMYLSHWIVVLNYGEMLMQGTPSEIVNDEAVIGAYLGERPTT